MRRVQRRHAVSAAVLVAATLGAGSAAPAPAATLTLSGGTLKYSAAAGEANVVTVANIPNATTLRLELAPMPAVVPAQCTKLDAVKVSCARTGVSRTTFDLA